MRAHKSFLLISLIFSLCVHGFGQTDPHDPWFPHEAEYFADGTENPAALPDGNPVSSTGQTGRQIVQDNAIPDAVQVADEFPEMISESPATTSQGPASIDLVIGRGSYTAGDVDGDVNSVAVPYNHTFNERVAVKVTVPIYYTLIKDADFSSFPPSDLSVWGGGVLCSVPYGVAIAADNKDYRWKVTPTAGLTWMNASDIDVGTWSAVAGLSSNYLRKLGDKVIFNLGNAITYYHNSKLRGNYAPLGRDNQALLVNGVQLIFPRDRWVFNVFVMDSRYLMDAAVDAYQTYGVGGGYRISKKNSIRIFFYTDQGHDYQAFSGGISSAWKF